jgi:2-oxo-4-hydroxy-4-carboxy-5-ureidoimidazoline decarboxylase
MTIDAINRLDRAGFVSEVGWVFEHSPWVAERAWPQRPFADVHALHLAMATQVLVADREAQLALLREHPDLGARARMSAASEGEQAGVGLDRLSPELYARLQSANATYRERFGFPFLFAVKGSTAEAIVDALESRLARSWDEEFDTAVQQVLRIAEFRLRDLLALP